MGFYDDTDIGKKNRLVKNSNVNNITEKQTITMSSYAFFINFILTILFIIPMFTMILGLLMSLGKINTLNGLITTVFPFLFKNLAVMGGIALLVFLNNFLDKRVQNKKW